MDQLEIPTENVLVTAAPGGHIVLGIKDRSNDSAAIVLNEQLAEVVMMLLTEAMASSLAGQSYAKGYSRVIQETPSSLN